MENNENFEINTNSEQDLKNEKLFELVDLKKRLRVARGKNIFLTILSILLLTIIIGIFTGGYLIFNRFKYFISGNKDNKLSTSSVVSNMDISAFDEKLKLIDDIVTNDFNYKKNNEEIQDNMYKAYFDSLHDPYSEYMPPRDLDEFIETTSGEYYGIGAQVSQDKVTKDSIVNEVFPDSPAEEAGLKIGDIFVEVNDEYVRGIDLNDIVAKIKGPEGTKVKFKIYRPDEDREVELESFRRKVENIIVNHKMLDYNIGYIDIASFTGKAYEQFIKAVNDLEENNAKSLIIDVRNNPGGELDTVLKILDYILRDNNGKYTLNQDNDQFQVGRTLLVYMRNKTEIIEEYYCDDNHELNLPIVILTNLESASAAELFTQCLRDYDKATIVGIRTFGKGIVQNLLPLNDGSAIKLTVSEYFSPSGYSINFKGIKPDYSVDYVGNEVEYGPNNEIVDIDEKEGVKYLFDRDGNQTIDTTYIPPIISTNSEIIKDENKNDHIENKKIYDFDNKFLEEEWYEDLEQNYSDPQIIQAIVILKDVE